MFRPQFEKVVIVLSTGRAGTMALARLFDAYYDNVCAFHEPHPSRHLRIASNCFLYRHLSQDAMAEILPFTVPPHVYKVASYRRLQDAA